MCVCVQVKYVCSAAGCKYFEVDRKSFASGLQMDEVLVLTRTTNTIRGVEVQSGVEKYEDFMLRIFLRTVPVCALLTHWLIFRNI